MSIYAIYNVTLEMYPFIEMITEVEKIEYHNLYIIKTKAPHRCHLQS